MTIPQHGDRPPETLEETCQRILATLESSKAQRTTPPPPLAKSNDKTRRAWLDSWLKIKANHPQLIELEKKVHRYCADYAKRPGGTCGRRLLIYGENGTGKSHAAKAIAAWAQRVAINLPLVHGEVGMRLAECQYFKWPVVVKNLYAGNWYVLEEMTRASMLILDDVGAEHENQSKIGVQNLYMILERMEKSWMVITTNIGPADWEAKFERRISSRFMRNTDLVPLDQVPDYNSL